MAELKIKLEEVKAEKNYDSIFVVQQRLENIQAEYKKLEKNVVKLVEFNEKQEKEINDLNKEVEQKEEMIQVYEHIVTFSPIYVNPNVQHTSNATEQDNNNNYINNSYRH